MKNSGGYLVGGPQVLVWLRLRLARSSPTLRGPAGEKSPIFLEMESPNLPSLSATDSMSGSRSYRVRSSRLASIGCSSHRAHADLGRLAADCRPRFVGSGTRANSNC